MIRNVILCCWFFLFCKSSVFSQDKIPLRDSLIANYIGFSLLSRCELNCRLGENLVDILSNEQYSFDFLVEVEPEVDYNFKQFKIWSYRNLGTYSYCKKPCDDNIDSLIEKYRISVGKLFESPFESKSGLMAFDTISKRLYFISGLDIQLDLIFYKNVDDKDLKMKLFAFAYETYYEKKRFSRYYNLGKNKVYFPGGVPTMRKYRR